MPHSPLVSKIRCHNPNLKKSKVCNRNYLTYIGTREGVDLSDPDFEKQLQKQLVTSDLVNEKDDYYMYDTAPNDIYLKYIAERPKSHGLFGNIDVSDIKALSSRMFRMTAEAKNIYRGIVSLCEEDAISLGYQHKKNWISYMNRVMPDIGNKFDIPVDKLEWAAAIHMEKGHPHCHYMFWSTDNKIHSSYIHVTVQNKCRQLLSREMFKEELSQEIINKTMYRDLILEFGKQELNDLKQSILREYRHCIPGTMGNYMSGEISRRFMQLIDHLPRTGRITYQLIPPDLKTDVDEITRLLLSHPDLQKHVTDYYDKTEKISAVRANTEEQAEWSRNKAQEDLEKRIGNIILTAAKEIRKNFRMIDRQIREAEYAEQQKEHLCKHACYSVFLMVFSAVLKANSQTLPDEDKKYRTHAKEYVNARAKRLKNTAHDQNNPEI